MQVENGLHNLPARLHIQHPAQIYPGQKYPLLKYQASHLRFEICQIHPHVESSFSPAVTLIC